MPKSEVIMPAIRRRRYTEEFKVEAVRLVRDSARPVAQVARDLGIAETQVYRWVAEHRQAEAQGTTRAGQRAEAEELARVKRELARVTQERDFLRRAAAFFAKESR
jgi:transposase